MKYQKNLTGKDVYDDEESFDDESDNLKKLKLKRI